MCQIYWEINHCAHWHGGFVCTISKLDLPEDLYCSLPSITKVLHVIWWFSSYWVFKNDTTSVDVYFLWHKQVYCTESTNIKNWQKIEIIRVTNDRTNLLFIWSNVFACCENAKTVATCGNEWIWKSLIEITALNSSARTLAATHLTTYLPLLLTLIVQWTSN